MVRVILLLNQVQVKLSYVFHPFEALQKSILFLSDLEAFRGQVDETSVCETIDCGSIPRRVKLSVIKKKVVTAFLCDVKH